jgi:ABC-type multidrug transport system ATPase subunit/pSer/pThr/pTyr-binding forkhead associated (FHA) protein
MKLLLEWANNSVLLDPERSYTLGRDNSSDVVIENSRISRTHLRLSFDGAAWTVNDLGSSNGSFHFNKQVSQKLIIGETELHLGGPGNLVLRLTPLTAEKNKKDKPTVNVLDKEATRLTKGILEENLGPQGPRRIRLQQRIKIGRDVKSDWKIDDLNVSRTHAEILQSRDGSYEIIDLKSTNGTFVNDNIVKREKLIFGDIIAVGGYRRKFTSDGLELLEGIDGLSITAKGISFKIGEKKLLEDVSFNLGPRTLTAIIGPSGAGKSTLLGVLTGRTKPTSGEIQLAGNNLHDNFQVLSREIGSVPQADILHTRLTVRQALLYGAQLRLPSDTSKEERNSRVNEVMRKLDLTERADLRIDRLSGGQRKRASIGLELLTSPKLLVLDEPTSGLDPGLDAHVMETLRNLADDGQTVVLVTHSVDNLNFCDNVILLASGGRVAYAGPASTVFSKLGKKNWAEVFKFLASPDAINLASKKHDVAISTEVKQEHVIQRKQGFLRQILTLSSRYTRVIASDRFYLALLTLIPVIIGVISYLAGSKYGFGPGYKTKTGLVYNPFAQGSILVLVLGSIFVGLSTSIQEVIKENAVRKREQSVGIRVTAYLFSKILVLGLITSTQIIVFTSIVLFGRPLPQSGIVLESSRIEITSVCVILGLCSMLLGLLISTLLSSEEQAMPALVGMTMVLVVLSGALPLESSGLVGQLSKFVPSHWATNALSASVDIVQLGFITDSFEQSKWESSTSNLTSSLGYVGIFAVLFVLLSVTKLKRSR